MLNITQHVQIFEFLWYWYTLTNYWERVCVRGRYKLYHSYLNGLRRQDFKLKRTFTENCTNYGKLSHHNVRAPHELWDKHFVSEFSSTAHLLIPWSTWSLNKITTIIIKCRYLLSLNPWKTGLKPVLISPSHFPPTVTCRVCFFLWPVPELADFWTSLIMNTTPAPGLGRWLIF